MKTKVAITKTYTIKLRGVPQTHKTIFELLRTICDSVKNGSVGEIELKTE